MTSRPEPRDQPPSTRTAVEAGIAWKVAVLLLVAKLIQWLILLLFALDRTAPGLPEVALGPHVLAGCWVGSSLVFVLWRRWLGLVSAVLYCGLSFFVSTALLIQNVDIVWNLVTALGSAGVIASLLVATIHRNFNHSRW
ncbi:MAG: hypothetical protein B5766_00520 [Candidatus Lumbricidophila eiseniae]|uniref:Uncharacterized protein n=1 Tax=Candidatus Lumbricidiphila eiseniae TaxID=1969409 RepID=A0A2A6FUY8_9MICO|nr:MAG: hypothetical protein B5766_00520 [Candidatus Lumbricidophila eiseniae]